MRYHVSLKCSNAALPQKFEVYGIESIQHSGNLTRASVWLPGFLGTVCEAATNPQNWMDSDPPNDNLVGLCPNGDSKLSQFWEMYIPIIATTVSPAVSPQKWFKNITGL
jgi:hypothetical protein